MKKKTVADIRALSGKTVFVTADFNISLVNGIVANDTRIREAVPTIEHILKKGAKPVIASHLGRPHGVDPALSLEPVARHLGQLLGVRVHLIPEFWKPEALNRIREVPKGEIVLLENVRYHEGEKKNDRALAKHLASMADYFVNEAFGASHRVHASTVGIAEFLPAYAGLLMDKEISMLGKAMEHPVRPFVVFIGGAKTPEKIAVIDKLLDLADTVALGGAIANTFLAAWGFGMGRSLVDYEMIEMARVVFWKTTRNHSALILPQDVVISNLTRTQAPREVDHNQVSSNVATYDIGTKTQAFYAGLIDEAKTVIWNGPMGLYEDERFRKGTDMLLKTIAGSRAFSIVGGGDTLTSIKNRQYMSEISHVSTGGSAMLAFLEKGTLPGIDVLLNR